MLIKSREQARNSKSTKFYRIVTTYSSWWDVRIKEFSRAEMLNKRLNFTNHIVFDNKEEAEEMVKKIKKLIQDHLFVDSENNVND